MEFRIALISASILAAPLVYPRLATAQPVTGPYLSAEGGFNAQTKTEAKDFVINGVGQPGTARISFYGGAAAELSAGYGFGDGFRVELEADFINNAYNRKTAAFAQYKATGSLKKYGGFANGFYDFNVGLPYLYPYLGAGAGYQIVNVTNYCAGGVCLSQPKGSFAYQGIAGLAFPIAPVPGLSFTVEYRFIGLTKAEKYCGGDFCGNLVHQYNNSVMAGIRYQLFSPQPPPPAPTPAPVAAPAPAPAKTYLVFFDWDKATLTPRATEIIAQAAADSKTQQTTTITVNGYTDTSGTPTYNQGLSVRRANAVAAQLVADGVPSSEITAQGFGETDLLVPTGPGVREPQNRRVQIILQ